MLLLLAVFTNCIPPLSLLCTLISGLQHDKHYHQPRQRSGEAGTSQTTWKERKKLLVRGQFIWMQLRSENREKFFTQIAYIWIWHTTHYLWSVAVGSFSTFCLVNFPCLRCTKVLSYIPWAGLELSGDKIGDVLTGSVVLFLLCTERAETRKTCFRSRRKCKFKHRKNLSVPTQALQGRTPTWGAKDPETTMEGCLWQLNLYLSVKISFSSNTSHWNSWEVSWPS